MEQTISKYPLIRVVLCLVNIGLIAACNYDGTPARKTEAKVFVIPTLVAALFVGIGVMSMSKKH